MSNQLTNMARELLAIEADISYRFNKHRKTWVDDFEMLTFEQVWGSTTCGFGGIGGQAMTKCRTYVFIPQVDGEDCFVYFGERFAYKVPYSQVFMDDVRNGRMAAVYGKGKYMVDDTK